ncbi:MAG: DUF4175 family protein, partial [Thermoguttaceae bacterium]
MKDQTTKPSFVVRFDKVHSAILRAELFRGACWTVLAAAGGVAMLAAADYHLELAWLVRAMVLGAVGLLAAVVSAVTILRPVLWWSRPRTAIEVEQRFPQLGQRVRTVVEFSGRAEQDVKAEGVAPTLVTALEEETETTARPLDLRAMVPRRKTAIAAAVAGMAILLLLGAIVLDQQSRLAVCRALLSDRPYTELEVTSGNLLVDQGDDATLSLKLTGRVDRRVVVYSRPADPPGGAWERRELPLAEAERPAGNVALHETTVEKLLHPIEYRVVAGPAESDIYRVGVRYPLAIDKFEAALTPPAYTGVEPSTVEGGDLEVIEGTDVDFQITLSRPCSEAFLVLSDPPSLDDENTEPPTERIAMAVDGTSLAARLSFTESKDYSIVATPRDGLPLRPNRYQVYVRPDLPPHVRFQGPAEALEVHPIAEVLMEIRADDDFGLSKSGIVFQVDNGPEHTLMAEDFIKTAALLSDDEKETPAN